MKNELLNIIVIYANYDNTGWGKSNAGVLKGY